MCIRNEKLMETFLQFTDRINSFEKPEMSLGDEYFSVSPSLERKVNTDNSFKNFYGDTVVFDLDGAVKEQINSCVDALYAAVPQCFCERLCPDTFHMTLHDLSNSATLSDCAEDVFLNELTVINKIRDVQKFKSANIKMKSNFIFNMVGTSLVMGLRPADAESYRVLTALYNIFDGVKKLNYPMTPHVTLAYYNINGFDAKAAKALENTVNRMNAEIAPAFSVNNLYYQKFTSMNNYVNILKLL